MATAEERFWAKVRKSDGCWEWTGTTRDGYGMFSAGGNRHVGAHRFSYELAKGKVLAGLMVCHTCDNRRCVRPDHLFVGTARDNVWDAINKGRRLRGPAHRPRMPKEVVGRTSRLYCKAGHLMLGENMEWKKNGLGTVARVCHACRVAAWRRAAKKNPRHHREVMTG